MKNSAERLDWALKSCERSHVRITSARAAVLEFLSEQRKPVNLDSIWQAKGVAGECDATTVYRTLMMFKDAGLVRCVGMLRKTSHFVLNVPEDASHFLICERCGAVVELQLPPNIIAGMRKLAEEHGFAASARCMDLHGLCRACEEEARKSVPASKLMARHCLA